MDKLTSMAVFAQVVESQSFSKAAERLGLSKSAVSKHVGSLEDRLGVVLLNRTVERAELLAADFPDLPVQCRPLSDLDHCLSTCSLVFTSTATEDPIIDAARLSRCSTMLAPRRRR